MSLFVGINNRKNSTKLTLMIPEQCELTKSEALFRLVEKARAGGGGYSFMGLIGMCRPMGWVFDGLHP